VILALLIAAGGIAVMLALGWGLVAAGLRAVDQAGDATVSAAADAGQLTVVVVVRNPGDVPLVAGFSARRRLLPDWLGAGMTVRAPSFAFRSAPRPAATC
jgi:hypothetical protein